MPYDPDKRQRSDNEIDAISFGNSGRAITPHDDNDLDPYAVAVVVTAAGNLVILPEQNDDGDTITFTDVPVGFIPPFRVRRVLDTGTTASVAAVDF
jgi:hypothetical protein